MKMKLTLEQINQTLLANTNAIEKLNRDAWDRHWANERNGLFFFGIAILLVLGTWFFLL